MVAMAIKLGSVAELVVRAHYIKYQFTAKNVWCLEGFAERNRLEMSRLDSVGEDACSPQPPCR